MTSAPLHPPGPPHQLPPEATLPEDRTLLEQPASGALRERLRVWWRAGTWRAPALVFAIALSVLTLTSGLTGHLAKPSTDTHFVYLANTYNSMIAAALGDEDARARRQGKVAFELDRAPPHYNDWASYWELTLRDGQEVRGTWVERHGRGRFEQLSGREMILSPEELRPGAPPRQRYFVSFPPGPALVMMPLAAVWQYHVNDVWVTLLSAALNVALMFALLERLARAGRSGRSRAENLWLTALFGFGTCHYWLAIMGQVWFTALVMGVSFTLMMMHCAIDRRHPFWAGVFCALAFATRTPLLFTCVFFFLFVLFPGGARLKRAQLPQAARELAWFCAPCLVVGVALLVMNYARFEQLSEFGHRYLAAGQIPRIKQYGLFHWHFLGKNLTSLLTLMPRLQGHAPYVVVSKHGMSMLLTTPTLLYLLWPRPRLGRADVFWHRALWLTVAACAIPGLFYQNTGYEQFGFRFSLDYTPYLIALLATGRAPMTRWFKATIVWSVGVNLFGAITFKRLRQFYTEDFFP